MRASGIVVGLGLVVVAAVLAIAAVLSLSNRTSWTDLEAGECFDLASAIADAEGDLADVTAVDPIDCSEPHDAEVVAAGELAPEGDRSYPPDDDLFAEIDRACAALVPDTVDPRRFGIVPIAPDERTWDDRRGRFVCVAVVIGGGTVIGSALD
jgi:hypothetical protein